MSDTGPKTPAGTETRATAPETAPEREEGRHPLVALRQEMDRLFDDFFAGFPMMPFRRRRLEADPWRRFQGVFEATFPVVDVAETEQGYQITAELPGMAEKDIDLSITGEMLVVKGEKRQEREEKKESYVVSERRYGSFQRTFPLPQDADPEKIEAHFKNGVLTITLPRKAGAETRQRKIEVKTV
jgi:HSP20 family protein